MTDATKATKTEAKKADKPAGFIVFETGGKQYRVTAGDVVKIEKLKGGNVAGDKVVFDKVLLIDDGKSTQIGTPYIEGATIEAEVTEAGRNKKITVIKYKAKSRYHKKRGHRQPFLKVKVTKV